MSQKRIALVAHDEKKNDMLQWVEAHRALLSRHQLWGTGTTGGMVVAETGLAVTCLKSGPLGGDQQLGAMISEGQLDVLIFFIDPMSTQPHDVDVKALVRLSTLYNILLACNPATASCLVTNPDF